MLLILIIVLVICLLLAKFAYKGKWLWRFCVINIIVIAVYSLAGWTYIINFLDTGGASLGPGLMLMYVTMLHIALLLIIVVVGTICQSVREQTYK
jgi:hypothetical protein